MIDKLFTHSESRRMLVTLGAAGILALIGGGIYAAAIHAVMPTHPPIARADRVQSAQNAAPSLRTIQLGGKTLRVSIADTEAKREQGLSGRAGLASDEGMFFVFSTDDKYGFWMKDMRFPIDIVWLASDGSVVYIVRNAAPESYPTSFVPNTPARYVVELPAGWANANHLAIGDKAQL
jgi:uncharacterized membrane protein (UPF0127 family)